MKLDQQQEKIILDLARDTLKHYMQEKEYISYPKYCLEEDDGIDQLADFLTKNNACFVTLKKDGELRGCIGTTSFSEKLIDNIMHNVVNAAIEDHRFLSLELGEVEDIKIEVSILSMPEDCQNINDFKLGTHGLIMDNGFSSGLFLPQVASENDFSKEDFLAHLAVKAGIEKDAYLGPNIKLKKFTALVISES
jgi:uncharacterized protein